MLSEVGFRIFSIYSSPLTPCVGSSLPWLSLPHSPAVFCTFWVVFQGMFSHFLCPGGGGLTSGCWMQTTPFISATNPVGFWPIVHCFSRFVFAFLGGFHCLIALWLLQSILTSLHTLPPPLPLPLHPYSKVCFRIFSPFTFS